MALLLIRITNYIDHTSKLILKILDILYYVRADTDILKTFFFSNLNVLITIHRTKSGNYLFLLK